MLSDEEKKDLIKNDERLGAKIGIKYVLQSLLEKE